MGRAGAGRVGVARSRLLGPPLRLVAALIAAAPFLVAAQLVTSTVVGGLGIQYAPPEQSASPAELAAWHGIGSALPATAAPVVLAYHDVRPDSTDPYVVSPLQLDRQLAAFAAAGYHSLSSAEFVAYLRGGPTPPRGLYLTFDDGIQGLYHYADPILARHHMNATSFLITGRVGHNQPYYLSWAEVGQLARSGRWDFQAHTHDLHTRGPVGPDKINGSLLTGSSWSANHRETVAEHQQRVNQDLTLMFADFAEHHLPRPQVFAYPFSEADTSYDRAAVEATATLIRHQFPVALTNKTASPTPASRRGTPNGVVERLEIFHTTDPTQLLTQIAAWTAIAPHVEHPLTDPLRWWDETNRGVADLGALTHRPGATVDPHTTYLSADYAPYASADWINYTITTDVRGLTREGNNANVLVRVGSNAETEIRTSCCSVQIVDATTNTVQTQQRIPVSDTHQLHIQVTNGALSVSVDTQPPLHLNTGTGPAYTGGIALASRRAASTSWPYFANMSIMETQ